MDSHNESEKYSLESTPPIEATSDNASVIALRVHLVGRVDDTRHTVEVATRDGCSLLSEAPQLYNGPICVIFMKLVDHEKATNALNGAGVCNTCYQVEEFIKPPEPAPHAVTLDAHHYAYGDDRSRKLNHDGENSSEEVHKKPEALLTSASPQTVDSQVSVAKHSVNQKNQQIKKLKEEKNAWEKKLSDEKEKFEKCQKEDEIKKLKDEVERQDNLIRKQTDEITKLKEENEILNKNHNDKIKEVEELKKECHGSKSYMEGAKQTTDKILEKAVVVITPQQSTSTQVYVKVDKP